jgi:nucleotide-binding universal stress UspA family protein
VALSGHPNGQRLIGIVADMARLHKAELIGVHVVEIDWSMPLDMDVAGRSDEIQQVLDLAEGTAEAAGVKLESVLLQARDVGAALVDEAVERDADLLVVGLAYRTKFGGDFAVGRTIPYVLKNAPCAVWVVREPIPEETS